MQLKKNECQAIWLIIAVEMWEEKKSKTELFVLSFTAD